MLLQMMMNDSAYNEQGNAFEFAQFRGSPSYFLPFPYLVMSLLSRCQSRKEREKGKEPLKSRRRPHPTDEKGGMDCFLLLATDA